MPASAKDIRRHDQPALAVDLVLLTVHDGQVKVLTQKRNDQKQAGGDWCLPGTIVRIDETLEQSAHRVLREKVGLRDAFIEQLQAFSDLDRDPRGRVVSVAFIALVPWKELTAKSPSDTKLQTVQYLGQGDTGPFAKVRDGQSRIQQMAFDHSRILGVAIQRIRGKLDYTSVGLELLPQRFTLRDLQEIHEAFLEAKLSKPAFRRKVRDRGLVRPTGKYESGKAFRPAELYERNNSGVKQ